MKRLLLACVLLTFPTVLFAQVVTAPKTMDFQQTDGDFALMVGYRVDFFQCASVVVGPPASCVGRATAPFQAGTPITKTGITTTVSPTRQISFVTPPMNGALASLPVGVGFIASLVGIADQGGGATAEVRGGDSNPFYSTVRLPAPPTNVTIR